MTTEADKLIQKLCWSLDQLEANATCWEGRGLYSAGMRDARKTLETAFFCELDEVGYFDN